MKSNTLRMYDKIFKDTKGNYKLFQRPNLPLLAWIGCKLIALTLPGGTLQQGISALATAFLFTWAFLELTVGNNYFRKALGFIVLVVIILSFFAP